MRQYISGLVCIHPKCGCGGLCDSGHPCPMEDNCCALCPACCADYDEDPMAYFDYGAHPEGVRRWNMLQADITAHMASDPIDDGVSPSGGLQLPTKETTDGQFRTEQVED